MFKIISNVFIFSNRALLFKEIRHFVYPGNKIKILNAHNAPKQTQLK